VKSKNSPSLDLTDIHDIKWDRADVHKIFYGKRMRLINYEEVVDTSATKSIDYVSYVMTCTVLRARECDTTLIDMHVPHENEKC
jgi:hypothetical protein